MAKGNAKQIRSMFDSEPVFAGNVASKPTKKPGNLAKNNAGKTGDDYSAISVPASIPDADYSSIRIPYTDRQLKFIRAAASTTRKHGKSLSGLNDLAADLGIPLTAWHPDWLTGDSGQSPAASVARSQAKPKIEPQQCQQCESIVYWVDPNAACHCSVCRKPPHPSMVVGIWRVMSERSSEEEGGDMRMWWAKGSEDDIGVGERGWKWISSREWVSDADRVVVDLDAVGF